MTTSEWPKLWNKVWIREKAHVKDKVRILGNAVLESKAYAGHENVASLFFFLEQVRYVCAKFVDVKLRCVDH